jgi:hypothetical protein
MIKVAPINTRNNAIAAIGVSTYHNHVDEDIDNDPGVLRNLVVLDKSLVVELSFPSMCMDVLLGRPVDGAFERHDRLERHCFVFLFGRTGQVTIHLPSGLDGVYLGLCVGMAIDDGWSTESALFSGPVNDVDMHRHSNHVEEGLDRKG